MAKTRKIPLRKSVVSGEIIDKRDLLRIVKTKDGENFHRSNRKEKWARRLH